MNIHERAIKQSSLYKNVLRLQKKNALERAIKKQYLEQNEIDFKLNQDTNTPDLLKRLIQQNTKRQMTKEEIGRFITKQFLLLRGFEAFGLNSYIKKVQKKGVNHDTYIFETDYYVTCNEGLEVIFTRLPYKGRRGQHGLYTFTEFPSLIHNQIKTDELIINQILIGLSRDLNKTWIHLTVDETPDESKESTSEDEDEDVVHDSVLENEELLWNICLKNLQ